MNTIIIVLLVLGVWYALFAWLLKVITAARRRRTLKIKRELREGLRLYTQDLRDELAELECDSQGGAL